MKKYNSPIARTIMLFEEHELMQTGSPDGRPGTSGGVGSGSEAGGGDSNRRGSSIWGED